jgi:hypothetical protein
MPPESFQRLSINQLQSYFVESPMNQLLVPIKRIEGSSKNAPIQNFDCSISLLSISNVYGLVFCAFEGTSCDQCVFVLAAT